jgi:hypothetical protein
MPVGIGVPVMERLPRRAGFAGGCALSARVPA